MISIFLRYLNLLVITLLVVVVFSFSLAFLFPGDPTLILTGLDSSTADSSRIFVNLDKGILVAFWQYFVSILNGDWGYSL